MNPKKEQYQEKLVDLVVFWTEIDVENCPEIDEWTASDIENEYARELRDQDLKRFPWCH